MLAAYPYSEFIFLVDQGICTFFDNQQVLQARNYGGVRSAKSLAAIFTPKVFWIIYSIIFGIFLPPPPLKYFPYHGMFFGCGPELLSRRVLLIENSIVSRDAYKFSFLIRIKTCNLRRITFQLFSSLPESEAYDIFEDGDESRDKQDCHTLEASKLVEHDLKKTLIKCMQDIFGKG